MRLVELAEETAVAQLRIVVAQVCPGLHDARRNAGILAADHHLGWRQCPRPRGDPRVEVGFGDPTRSGFERLVVCPVRVAHDPTERPPLGVGEARDGDPAFVGNRIGCGAGAGVAVVRCRNVVGQAVAGRVRGAAVGEVVEQGGAEEVDAHLELGHVDALTAAGVSACLDGGEDCASPVQPGAVVVVGVADADVLASRYAGQVGQAGEGVNGRRIGDEVRPWTAVAHPGHLDVDDFRAGGMDVVVTDAPAVEDADREVVYDDVGLLGEASADVATLGSGHVQREPPLVPVPHDVVGAVRSVGAGPGRRVHLDHVGTEVAEDARGERPGENVREIEDAQSFERAGVGRGVRDR